MGGMGRLGSVIIRSSFGVPIVFVYRLYKGGNKLFLSLRPLKKHIQKKMKKRFLIVALFALFLGGVVAAQAQEQASTLTELQAEKEKLEDKLAKVIEEKENAENSLVGKYKDVAFAFNKHISKKQKKFAKIVLRGAKRKEKRIKKELKRLNKRIEKISKLED